MIYAIIEASGKQIWIQPGCFYDINKINAKPGEVIKLEKRRHETLHDTSLNLFSNLFLYVSYILNHIKHTCMCSL